jgi:peroxiredoxin
MDPIAELNQPAPDFILPDLKGVHHRLSDLLGKIVIVNFWSADCPWSERVDRELLPLVKSWGEQVALVTVTSSSQEPPDLLRQAATGQGLPFVLHDADKTVARLYGAVATPHCFVVDADGLLRYRGAFDDVTFRHRTPTRGYLCQAVEALLAGQAPDPAETPAYGCAIY